MYFLILAPFSQNYEFGVEVKKHHFFLRVKSYHICFTVDETIDETKSSLDETKSSLDETKSSLKAKSSLRQDEELI